jgi:hypothetical protein
MRRDGGCYYQSLEIASARHFHIRVEGEADLS